MPLTSKKEVKRLLKKHGVQPSKRLGQNFLVDRGVLRDIIGAAELNKNDIVLEIGPGIGTLTLELASRVKKVVAVEKDKRMAEVLRETLGGHKNIKIIGGDILTTNNYQPTTNNHKVVANLPYYIVSPTIRMFLEAKYSPALMVLMVQKEVAQRICAKPPHMNLLAISVQFYADPKIVRYVKKTSFWPQPKVDGAIIKIVPRQFRVPVPRQFRERFFRIIKAGFSHPRKQLVNNLSRGLKMGRPETIRLLSAAGINPTRRAESLTMQEWIKLGKSDFPCW